MCPWLIWWSADRKRNYYNYITNVKDVIIEGRVLGLFRLRESLAQTEAEQGFGRGVVDRRFGCGLEARKIVLIEERGRLSRHNFIRDKIISTFI